MNLLALSGSTRTASTNTALLRGLTHTCPAGVHIEVFAALGSLPIFDADMEGANTPSAVREFIRLIESADGIIIASPEYAHAIPGGLKNAIDWLVSREEIIHKPVAVAHASHRGDDMLRSLNLVLGTVTERFAADVFLRVPSLGRSADDIRAVLAAPGTVAEMYDFVVAFRDYILRSEHHR